MINMEAIKQDVQQVENYLAAGQVSAAYNFIYSQPAEFQLSILVLLQLRLMNTLIQHSKESK